jgi:uncharacterized protein YbjQ (UPF0145 family)
VVEYVHMIKTTTNTIEGTKIKSYLGVITADVIIGANIFSDIFAGIRDIVGGRSASYEKKFEEGKAMAIAELEGEATRLGANAIVGVDFDYETIGSNGSMLMIAVSGTAVIVE